MDPQFAFTYFSAHATPVELFRQLYAAPYSAPEHHGNTPGGQPWTLRYYVQDAIRAFKSKNPPPSGTPEEQLSDGQIRELMAVFSREHFKIRIFIEGPNGEEVFPTETEGPYPLEDTILPGMKRIASMMLSFISSGLIPAPKNYKVSRKIFWRLNKSFPVANAREEIFRVVEGTNFEFSSSSSENLTVSATAGVNFGPFGAALTTEYSTGSSEAQSYAYMKQTTHEIKDRYEAANGNVTYYYVWEACHEIILINPDTNKELCKSTYTFVPTKILRYEVTSPSRNVEEAVNMHEKLRRGDLPSITQTPVTEEHVKAHLDEYLRAFHILPKKE